MTNLGFLIAARNEESSIKATIDSAMQQESPPDWVVVVVNNTTDNTAEVAREAGAIVYEMIENRHKKAGALNFGLEQMMPNLGDDDIVVIADADTVVASDFCTVAQATMLNDERVGCVSSIFTGRSSNRLLGKLQAMEFYRYKREIKRYGSEAFVASGTASAFRVGALRAVKAARNGITLPYGESYYDIVSLTEDNELTLALKTLHYTCPAPGVISVTDVIENVVDLYHQRHRWYLGALHNLSAYGRMLPVRLRFVYWRQQAGLYFALATVMLMATSLVIVLSAALSGAVYFSPIWLIPSAVLLIERTTGVWKMGVRERLIAALLIPEMLYSLFLLGTFASAAYYSMFAKGRQAAWRAT